MLCKYFTIVNNTSVTILRLSYFGNIKASKYMDGLASFNEIAPIRFPPSSIPKILSPSLRISPSKLLFMKGGEK